MNNEFNFLPLYTVLREVSKRCVDTERKNKSEKTLNWELVGGERIYIQICIKEGKEGMGW